MDRGFQATRSLALLAQLCLLAGCAAQSSSGRGPLSGPTTEVARDRATPLPPPPAPAPAGAAAGPVEPAGDPYAGVRPMDAELARAMRQSQRHYAAAREAFRGGELARAREQFDAAVDAFTGGGLDDRPEAQALVEALLAQVAAYESAWVEARADAGELAELEPPDEGAEDEPAPLDTIAEVDLPDQVTHTEAVVAEPTSRLAHDMPLQVNNQVRFMLELYKGRLKSEILPAFVRSGRYLPMVQQIFREEGVPQDLAWLALVESGFKPHAYSVAAAKGMWQFMRATGRLYGLQSDFWMDERADPVKATRAAARHLRDLHARYDDWYLALAAYNAGAGKVDRAIARVRNKDYWAIAATRHLRAETKNYVPAFLATLLIVDDPAAHGFDFTPELPWAFEEVRVEGPADLTVLARCAGISEEELRRHNPELRRGMTPANRSHYELKVPLGVRASFERAYAELPAGERLRFATHQVGKGDTVARVARRYGVRPEAIAAANRLGTGTRLAAGSALRVPLSEGYAPPSGWREDEGRRSGRRGGAAHVVRRGETLSRIASRYGVSVGQLRSWNRLGSDRIVAGRRLKVGGGGSAGAGIAPARAARQTTVAAAGRPVKHRVRRGETLVGIAGRYGVSVRDLVAWNNRLSGRTLQAGEVLRLFLGSTESARSLGRREPR